MTNNKYLKCLRYYNRETRNPYPSSPAWYCWKTEAYWFSKISESCDQGQEINSVFANEIKRYVSQGLSEFNKSDGIPLSLKACLFQLFEHWNEGMASTEEFTLFYNKWLTKNL